MKLNIGEPKNEAQKRILDYLEENVSAPLALKIQKHKKTLEQCWQYIVSEAKKKAVGSCACIADEEVFGWAIHFFEDVEIKDKAIIDTARERKVEESMRKRNEDMKKAGVYDKESPNYTKPNNVVPMKKPKKAETELDQITFDDLFSNGVWT